MATLITLQPNKSYKTVANAVKAVEASCYGDPAYIDLRYLVHRDEVTGRYFPVFIGLQALHANVHFHFHVVA